LRRFVTRDEQCRAEPLIQRIFEEQRYLVARHDEIRDVTSKLVEFVLKQASYARVNDGVEAGSRPGVSEDDFAERRAVEHVVVDHTFEGECNLSKGRLSWVDRTPSQLVGVNHVHALISQYASDRALAGRDAPGKTKQEQTWARKHG
jgi:hypothetical protein